MGPYRAKFNAPVLGINKYGTATSPAWANQNLYPRAVGDVNWDGKADIAGFHSTGAFVSRSQ